MIFQICWKLWNQIASVVQAVKQASIRVLSSLQVQNSVTCRSVHCESQISTDYQRKGNSALLRSPWILFRYLGSWFSQMMLHTNIIYNYYTCHKIICFILMCGYNYYSAIMLWQNKRNLRATQWELFHLKTWVWCITTRHIRALSLYIDLRFDGNNATTPKSLA